MKSGEKWSECLKRLRERLLISGVDVLRRVWRWLQHHSFRKSGDVAIHEMLETGGGTKRS